MGTPPDEVDQVDRTPMSDVKDDDTFGVGTPEQVAADDRTTRARLHHFHRRAGPPFDDGTFERWLTEVKPMVDATSS